MHILTHFLPCDAMQVRPMASCSVRPSVRLSCLYILSKRIKISSQFFPPSDSHTILGFSYQTSWQYSDRNPPNGGVECRVGRNHSSELISAFITCCQCCDRLGVTITCCRTVASCDTYELVVSSSVC